MPHRRPPRLPTFDYRGAHRYFVTCCAAERRRVFVEGDFVQVLVQQILHAASEHGFAVLAYVFMPNHLHLLVEGQTADADFRAFMRFLRRRTALEYRRLTLLELWQNGYYERVLRRDEATPAIISYILGNPVRAGLVENATDYRFGWTIDLDACQRI
ncbi:MAG: REP-associated tyrosine transposase [Acidobacteriota bacterium]